MKYQPSLPEHNDNISHIHPLREFLLLLSGVIAILLLGFWALGFAVDYAVDHLSPEQESQLFATIDFDWEFGKESDPAEQDKLQELIDSLRTCVHLPYPVTVSLVESEDVNAIALPGGKIIVLSGLLEKVSSANGLSFVLAHELGHFKNRDHLRLMGRGIVLATLSAIFTGADSSLSQMLASTINLRTAKYSQSRESKADQTGLRALNCYFGHVGGATELFESLQQEEKSLDFGMSHYFDSHPELQQRIDDLLQLTQKLGFSEQETRMLWY